MYRGLEIAVVVPAFNEEQAIRRVIRVVPGFVDRIIVVDDASADRTARLATKLKRPGLEIIRHLHNRGVGGAIVTGYQRALALGVDVTAVMAGDGQMDPTDLPGLIDAIADGRADYAKGNRFLRREVWRTMPTTRIVGNIALSLCTKVVTGYWRLFDSQCGYTAASHQALAALELDRLFPRYGYPNDLLARLHAAALRVVDVPVRPIYGPQWKSGIRLRTLLHPIPWVLARAFFRRLLRESKRDVTSLLPKTAGRPTLTP